MPEVSIKYGNMEGVGANVTAAKKDAMRKIEAALEGSYMPTFIQHGGTTAIIARDALSGWGYALIHPDEQKPSRTLYLQGALSGHSEKHMREAIEAAAYHVAQCAGHFNGIEHLLPERKQRDLTDYFSNQARYRDARDQGMTDEEARDAAFGLQRQAAPRARP